MNNVERHACAQRVEVRLSFRRDRVLVAVCDDGRGFTPGGANLSLGLPGNQERAGLLGGELRVESAPGRGTLVQVIIPASA